MTRKTCTHCGNRFEAKFPNAKLCLPCWQKRERALEEYDDMQTELWALRDALAARTPATSVTTQIPADVLRRLILLCHPDRHGNSEAANVVTRWLLGQRR